MTLTRWIGGPNKELMPAGVVATTYNLVENEIPIYYEAFYTYAVRSVYRTELPFQPGSLVVLVGNTQVDYLERGSDYREMEIRNRTITGYIRFFYTPKNQDDLYGTANLAFNKTRTWINQKVVAIDKDIINQIRVAISAIENHMNLASTRWTGGIFSDSKGTVVGTANIPSTYVSNIFDQETLYVKSMFTELSDRIAFLASRANLDITNEAPQLVLDTSLSQGWVEAMRTIINNIEARVT